jgi:hypothetical protein
MLQIQQLAAKGSEYITCEQQQKIHGGIEANSPEEDLWSAYSAGSYDISTEGDDIIRFAPTAPDTNFTYVIDEDSDFIRLEQNYSPKSRFG